MISGDLQRFGTKLKLSLRMHETKGGRLLTSAQASGKTLAELEASAREAAGALMTGASQ